MRFRKRVKIFPGFYLNFSGAGVSTTLGVKGASVNFNKKGTYLNTGIPGTGLYDRQKIGRGRNSSNTQSFHNAITDDMESYHPEALIGEIKSADTDKLTSASLVELKETLEEVYQDRMELLQEIQLTKKEIKSARGIRVVACIFLIGFFIKSFKNKMIDKEEYLVDLENQLKNSVVNIDVLFDKSFEEKYNLMLNAYKVLLTSEIIWDKTSSSQHNRKNSRSAASTAVTRTPVKFKFDHIDIIKSSYAAFHFENKNGGDLYIYPAFVIVTSNKKEFALIDIKDFQIQFLEQKFIEEEIIPSDTKIIRYTWARANKDGSPDRRFANNYEVPVVQYGEIEIKSSSGLHENYTFSSFEKSEAFVQAFAAYQHRI